MTAPLRVVIDLQALQVAGYADRGVGRYVAAYGGALAAMDRVAAALVAPELPPPASLPSSLTTSGAVRWDSRATARRLMAEGGRLARLVPAPFLHCGPDEPGVLVVAPHWEEAGLPRVVLVHDLIPLRFPDQYLPSAEHVARYRARADWVAGADLVVTNSEHTRTEVVELLGRDPAGVVRVGAGVSPYFTPPDGTDAELFRFYFPALEHRPFVMTVSGSDARKGTERLVQAMATVVRDGVDADLLVVGALTTEWQERLRTAARHAKLGGRLVLAGAVHDELLRACYRRAVASVLPSRAEGFGLPVLESAACATPALASDRGALAEVAATPLATFDPEDTSSLARAVAGIVTDDDRRRAVLEAQRVLAARSTWGAVADATARALDALDGGGRPGTRGSPAPPALAPRVALVGPLPPVASGIATYSSRLLHAAAQGRPGVGVDAVSTMTAPPALPPGVAYVPVDALGHEARAASYDAVVYALGNSDGHLATVESALRYPGWLWLHEVRLPAIAVTALDHLDDDAFAGAMAWLLDRAYPGRGPHDAARRARRSVLDLVAGGVGLVPLLAERCRGILVNSEVAARLLELDLPPLAHHPPVHVLPPACPPPWPGERAEPEGEPVVVALGVASMAKRPDLLVDAAALAGCRLAFVGPCHPTVEQVIGDRARLRGTAARVEVTGEVDDGRWRHWLARAAVAVQLREATTGETSAAVLEALAAGVPVLTNVDSAAEYPAGTVALVAGTDPAVVAAGLTDLLACAERRRTLSGAGKEFAAAHSFGALAERLVSVVTS
ncbi:MAG TPA: glycosyltransferase [Acidimicrobiales bacterium]|nr:glycosyltransferase [Acidimicrobiales bacterium]